MAYGYITPYREPPEAGSKSSSDALPEMQSAREQNTNGEFGEITLIDDIGTKIEANA